MKLRNASRPAIIGAAAIAAVALTLTGTAVADALITSHDIKDNTIRGKDIRDGTIRASDLHSGSVASDEVLNGSLNYGDLSGSAISRIQNGVFVGEHWGQVLRNTLETGVATLRSGPYAGTTVKPPLGTGSLEILTGNAASQVSFGNEVDFLGKNFVSTVGNDVGFSMYSTGENIDRNVDNAANIKFEIDPHIAGLLYTSGPRTGQRVDYGTLNFAPTKNATANAWTSYNATEGDWTLTGPAGGTVANGGINCNQTTACTFAEVKQRLANATILTVAVGKGRDYAFQGAVDALRIGNTVYDFEARGVIARRPA